MAKALLKDHLLVMCFYFFQENVLEKGKIN